jgi:hypothetical protein
MKKSPPPSRHCGGIFGRMLSGKAPHRTEYIKRI